MLTQQTVIDNPAYAPGWFWFPRVGAGYFCPPKTGFSSMKALFPDHHTGLRPSKEIPVRVCVREPYDRFLSLYNMTVLNSYYRENGWGRLAGGFSESWLNRWFPDPQTISDPVAFAQEWLLEAAAPLDAWGGDLHVMSQSRCYRNLLGPDWQRRPGSELIPMHRWAEVIHTDLGVRYRVNNRAVYTVPRSRFVSLRELVYRTWPEDLELYTQACRVQG